MYHGASYTHEGTIAFFLYFFSSLSLPPKHPRIQAAQTMRTKVQFDFYELPAESYMSLRDSILNHIDRRREPSWACTLDEGDFPVIFLFLLLFGRGFPEADR